MLKRLLSVAMSGLLLATTAIATPAMAAGSAPIDISAPLDGFSRQELETTYTKDAPYTTADGFKAPTGKNMTAELKADSSVGEYFRITPADGYAALGTGDKGGVGLYNSDIKIGSEHKVFTTSITFRQNKHTNLRWYFYDANGDVVQTFPLRWWGGTIQKLHSPIVNGQTSGKGYVANQKIVFELDVWYTITYTIDINKKTLRVVVDGGKFDNITWTSAIYDTGIAGIVDNAPLSGVGVGYLDGDADATNTFDVANMSLSTSGSTTAYDEKLTFENGTFADSESSSWTNGTWSAAAETTITRDKTDFGGSHKYAVKLTPTSSKPLNIVNTIPTGKTVGSDGVLVVESSYYEHNFAQMRLTIGGVDSSGSAKTLKVLDYERTDNRNYNFCGATAESLPQLNDKWRRFRFVFDLKNDNVSMYTWDELNPTDMILKVNSAAMADFADITSVTYIFYPRTWGDGRYMAIDDFRVYEKDAIRYTGSTPADNTRSRVALDVKPMMEFNMPIADSAISDMVTLEDSKGNAIDGTASLSPCGYGIMFTPDSILSPDDTYTYTIDGTLTDIFGQTLAIDKSISFSTSPSIKLKDCTFKQGDTIVTQNSELTCDSAISATVELAPNYGSVPVTLLLGLYDADTDIMVDAKAVYIASLTDTTQTLTLDKPMVAGFDYYPAVFVWSGVETAVPYMEYISLK